MRRFDLLLVLSSVSYAQYTVTTVAGGGPSTFQSGAIARDASGNTYVCGGVIVARIDPTGKVAPYAGTGIAGYSGDGGPALNAQLNGNGSCAFDPNGNLIVTDSNNARIRRIDPSGNITTIVGTGVSGDLGNGEPGSSAQVGFVLALAVDPSGAVYFSDEAHSIRVLKPSGLVEPYAGDGELMVSGDGGPATSAGLDFPTSLTVDAAGNLYFADLYYQNRIVRRISPSGTISTVAGAYSGSPLQNGALATSGTLAAINGLAADAAGNRFSATANTFAASMRKQASSPQSPERWHPERLQLAPP